MPKPPALSAIQAAPVCDIDSNHGAMQAEHIHHIDGTVNKEFGLYWFCPVKGCVGYGGKVETKARKLEPAQDQQLPLFQTAKGILK